MKHFKLTIIILGFLLFGCRQTTNRDILVTDSEDALITDENSVDAANKAEIKNLIRQVYKWHESRESSNNDMLTDDNDSIYIGFNLDQLKLDINELKTSNLFSDEFIDNYNKIFLTLDKKLRNKELEWSVGDLPPFGNDANPWCNCQDVPYDNPNPWDLIEIETINLDNNKGEFVWKWGNLELNEGDGWDEFTYRFRVVKEDERWKISYLEGFNFDEFTRKNH